MRKLMLSAVFFVPALLMVIAIVRYGQTMKPVSEGRTHIGREHIWYFEDTAGNIQVQDLFNKQQELFQPLPGTGDDPNFGFNPHDIWLKFEINGAQIPWGSEILQINNPLLNEVALYEITDHGPVMMSITGDNHFFGSRPIEHRTYRFPIAFVERETRTYYAKINAAGEQLLAPITVWTKHSLAEKDALDNLVRGCYFGLIVFVLLFTLFLYLRLREKSSLYYVHYNFNLLLLQLSLGGYAFQFFWPNNSYLANISTPVFASLSILALLKFSQMFLQLREYFPRIHRWLNYVGYLIIFNIGLSLIGTPTTFPISVLLINVIALLINFAIIPVTIMVLRKGYKPAKFFLIGFITLVITVFGFIATNLGLIRNEFYAEYGLLIGSAAETILLSFAVVDKFHSFKDQALQSLKELNRIEREQNEVLERAVLERTEEILHQKTELENQKEEILSSIRYAERIQRNLLPTEADMKTTFPDSFVIYRPKDIVSGDFYWVGKTRLNGVVGPAHEVSLLATGDCTGHGVPGAMVSVMGCNLLRETLQQHPEALPHEMLEEIDRRMKQTMNLQEGMNVSDGMDMALFAFQHDTMELRVAAANHCLFIWNGEDLVTIKGTNRPIGYSPYSDKTAFTTTTYQLKKGDIVYAFTDGFADQFGGENNKKLKLSGLRNLLLSLVNFNMDEQRQRLIQFLNTWQGDHEQIDDISLIGIRV
ncbi:MAG: SpoIIE family protein phosphatase [Flavobacteriales bacterium]|nr:SpoIIE family protein phosphatase [Flavobacteriales bacterium]